MKEVTQEFKSIRLPARLVRKTWELLLSIRADCQYTTVSAMDRRHACGSRACLVILGPAAGRHSVHHEGTPR
jgi:hypothetical protein